MGVSTPTYEETRRKRMEENKKRMEELNLNNLSTALRPSISPKPSPVKQSKPRTVRPHVDPSFLRRSNRVADKPAPNYNEVAVEPFSLPRSRKSYQRRDLLNRVYAADRDRMNAILRAEKLESGLDSTFPSFVKPMLQSHVTGGFWLGLPSSFCTDHLPKDDEIFTLEDDDGNESKSKYLGKKNGLSAGWRGWAIEHELVDGDALVFHLIKPRKFKVYIIRVNESGDEENDGDSQEAPGEDEDDEDSHEAPGVPKLRNSAKRGRAIDEAPVVPKLRNSAKRVRAGKS